MTAFDSTQTSPSRLDDTTIVAMRAALSAYVVDPARHGSLQHALTAFVAEAHEKNMFPEQLLVALKDVWHGLPVVRALSNSTERAHLLQRVVTLGITEYYRV